jgi:uncharacterized lipoprotein YddW (UPF0748 family)
MIHQKLGLLVAGIFPILVAASCSGSKSAAGKQELVQQQVPPQAAAEFRAAWVATVANINWPSKRGLSTAEQQREAIELLDFLKEHHFNAVIFQVRPQADALYQSNIEPWSYFLSGVQGKAPDPFYDPLQFWTEAAHDRGLELHVWLNPYRAHHSAGGPVSDSSIVKRKPALVVPLKDNYWWFDPSLKGTRDHGTAVVMDIVKRYDIDGVHFDDYFYPYAEYNKGADFPDSASYAAYTAGGGKLARADWRRESVNTFIEQLYKEIKKEKPYVKFGLSPFGIWKPGYPASVEGFSQYDKLYADARLWLNKGWVDYFTPQLYWRINDIPHSFPVLLGWWSGENTMGRHLWPGINVGSDTSAKNVNEVNSQIMITRGLVPKSSGEVHWSMSSLTKNPNMAKGILEGPYKKQALVPASPWLDNKAPVAPAATTAAMPGDSVRISWTHADEKEVFHWVVYQQYGSSWTYTILNRNDRSIVIPRTGGGGKQPAALKRIAVTAVDRTGNESDRSEVEPALIVTRAGWNANEPKPYKQHMPVRITVHHEGAVFKPGTDAGKHIKNIQVWGMGKDRNWADIPYHFLIAPDGTIYEGRDVYTTGETATEYDPTGHLLICCEGDLEKQDMPPQQLDALIRLIAYAAKKYKLPYETLATHKDFAKTDCPGKNLYHYFENGYIKSKVREML